MLSCPLETSTGTIIGNSSVPIALRCQGILGGRLAMEPPLQILLWGRQHRGKPSSSLLVTGWGDQESVTQLQKTVVLQSIAQCCWTCIVQRRKVENVGTFSQTAKQPDYMLWKWNFWKTTIRSMLAWVWFSVYIGGCKQWNLQRLLSCSPSPEGSLQAPWGFCFCTLLSVEDLWQVGERIWGEKQTLLEQIINCFSPTPRKNLKQMEKAWEFFQGGPGLFCWAQHN